MAEVIVKRKRELMHSDVYLGEEHDDGLMHWKYIKREKVNGKWRYYYTDTGLSDIRKKYFEADDEYQDAKKTSRLYRNFVLYYQNQLDKENGGDLAKTDADKNLQQWKKQADEASDKVAPAYRKAKYLRKQYDRAYEKYEKSAGHKVADFLNKSSDAIYKGKKWLKNLFK